MEYPVRTFPRGGGERVVADKIEAIRPRNRQDALERIFAAGPWGRSDDEAFCRGGTFLSLHGGIALTCPNWQGKMR